MSVGPTTRTCLARSGVGGRGKLARKAFVLCSLRERVSEASWYKDTVAVTLTSGAVCFLGQTLWAALACAQRLKAFAGAVRYGRKHATCPAARAGQGQLRVSTEEYLRLPRNGEAGCAMGLEQKAMLWAGGGCRVGCRRTHRLN